MESLLQEPEPDAWPQIAPLLDEAVAQLAEADRNAVVLRFYEQRPLEEVGRVLGLNADAAQKRVSRALEKLRGSFARRGVVLDERRTAPAEEIRLRKSKDGVVLKVTIREGRKRQLRRVAAILGRRLLLWGSSLVRSRSMESRWKGWPSSSPLITVAVRPVSLTRTASTNSILTSSTPGRWSANTR